MFTRKRVTIILLVAGTVILAMGIGLRFAGPARALPPAQPGMTIPYTGLLTNEAGKPVTDGTYEFSFALYDAATGGALLWSETQGGVPVLEGRFTALLGSASPLPKEVSGGEALWLEVALRGPGGAGYARLAPRQEVSAVAPAVPLGGTSLAGSPSCAHTHLGEVWYSSIPWANAGLRINNNANGPAFWGYNTNPTGGNGVRGNATGSGLGVYGQSDSGAGVAGRSTGGHGVEGYSSGLGKAGVYGKNESSTSGSAHGVWGETVNGDGSAAGVYGLSQTGYAIGVYGYTTSPNGWAGMFGSPTGNGVKISVGTGKTGLTVLGGTKSAAVETDQGSRLLYSEESTQVWFSDYGFAALENRAAVIPIDPLFAQTANLEAPYHVFLQAYGDADLYVTDRTATQFQVLLRDGDPNVEFSYRIVAKRRGYEEHRLEPTP